MAIGTLAGRRCIITGASRGIGVAIAHRFAAEGAACTLIGRNPKTLETLSASLLRDKFIEPNPHRIAVGDVADRSFWARLTVAEVSALLKSSLRGWGLRYMRVFEEGCRYTGECCGGDALQLVGGDAAEVGGGGGGD
jgi:NAD(P)-dependent dehydrogenase (short-subunit alcohol dehydrogenase family)